MLALGQMLSFAFLLSGRMGGEGSGPTQGSAHSGRSNRQDLLVEKSTRQQVEWGG